MPVRVIFRCEFCDRQPDPLTQLDLEGQLREIVWGQYLDVGAENWLVWHGRGLYGRTRYACPDHRGDLTAYLREHYGTLGWHPWKRPPYPHTAVTSDTERAAKHGARSTMSKWGFGPKIA